MQRHCYGLTLHLFYDHPDQDGVTHSLELPPVSAFGDTPHQAMEQLQQAWQGVKKSYKQRGEKVPITPSLKAYRGQFKVCIDKRLHKALAIEAVQCGLSLNALLAQKLVRSTTMPVV